jgi:thiol:disulfide interchange protein
VKTVSGARRIVRIAAGFTLLAVGVVLLALPGPGLLTIALGLGMLAADFAWARRLLDRLKTGAGRLANTRWMRRAGRPRNDAPRPD